MLVGSPVKWSIFWTCASARCAYGQGKYAKSWSSIIANSPCAHANSTESSSSRAGAISHRPCRRKYDAPVVSRNLKHLVEIGEKGRKKCRERWVQQWMLLDEERFCMRERTEKKIWGWQTTKYKMAVLSIKSTSMADGFHDDPDYDDDDLDDDLLR